MAMEEKGFPPPKKKAKHLDTSPYIAEDKGKRREENTVEEMMSPIERKIVNVILRVGPWLTPVPTAYIVGRAAMHAFNLPLLVAVIAGIAVEVLGLAAIHTAMLVHDWADQVNGDPSRPPKRLANLAVLGYVVTVLLLTTVLEVRPDLRPYGTLILPLMSILAGTNIALANRYDRAARAKSQEQAGHPKEDTSKTQTVIENVRATVIPTNSVRTNGKNGVKVNGTNGANGKGRTNSVPTVREGIVSFLSAHPGASVRQVADAIGRSRSVTHKHMRVLV